MYIITVYRNVFWIESVEMADHSKLEQPHSDLIVFDEASIRRIWQENTWWLSVVDVRIAQIRPAVSPDSVHPFPQSRAYPKE